MSIDYRVVAIIANVLLEQLGLPIPAVPTLVVSGTLAAQGRLPAGTVLLGAVLACVLADAAWFLAGRVYGNNVMKLLCRISLTPDSCVSETQSRFERWGSNALLVAKFVPGLSLIAPPLAGATGMPWVRFLGYSALGAFAWVGAAIMGGMLFRHQIEQLMPRLADFGLVALEVFCVLLVVYIAYKWWERMRFYSVLRMAQIEVVELHQMMATSSRTPVVIDVRSPTAVQLEPRRIP